ncbi:MAG: hypothetical protein R2909_09680 [Gemmatimonadales bacterium]
MTPSAVSPLPLVVRDDLEARYADVMTPEAMAAMALLAGYNTDRLELMSQRLERRAERIRERRRIDFLDPNWQIPRTGLTVADAREGRFDGSTIPPDLRRQWIQGTGPAAKPNAPVESSIRNVAYALLSGADGWMFDGEDALGQIDSMSLDNQRNLKLAIHRDPMFLKVAEQVAGEMNRWAEGFFGRRHLEQLEFLQMRRLHLDDRHVGSPTASRARRLDRPVLYVVNNHKALLEQKRSGRALSPQDPRRPKRRSGTRC